MLFGLALLGIVLGAAGTEVFRARKPEAVKKIEEAAKRFVDSLSSSKSGSDKAKKK